MIRNLSEYFAPQAGSGKKSTTLQPIVLVVGILISALIGSFLFKAPSWVYICILVFVFIVLGLFVYSYDYFMRNNPDALRSEKFQITKLAIERGLVGDDSLSTPISFEEKRSLPQAPDDEDPL